jgi:uncharacterized membrane protein YeiB
LISNPEKINISKIISDGKTEEKVKAGQRLVGLDMARGLAFLGMVVVNFKEAMAMSAKSPGWLDWLSGLPEGRASSTFVLLAGVGISLLNGPRSQDITNRGPLLRKALLLFIVGLLYFPLWPGDILHYYGVFFAIGALALGWTDRALVLGALGFVFSFVALISLFDYSAGWDWKSMEYHDFWTLPGFIRNLFFNGFHPLIPWAAFLLTGMFIGRKDLFNPKIRRRLLTWGVALAVVAEVFSRLLRGPAAGFFPSLKTGDLKALFAVWDNSMPPMPLYMFSAAGTAMTVIALCLSLADRYKDTPWVGALAATGRLSLTLYVGHVVVGMGILWVMGRLYGQSLPFAMACAVLAGACGVLFAYVYTKWFKRGPLEYALRLFSKGSGG